MVYVDAGTKHGLWVTYHCFWYWDYIASEGRRTDTDELERILNEADIIYLRY
jgi:hypothetical protein